MNAYTKLEVDPLVHIRGLIDALEKYRVDITKALCYSNDSHSFNDVCIQVLGGKVDLYELPNAVLLMEYTKYPNHTVYHGYIAAGDLGEILDAHKMIEGEATKRGCKYLTIAGRRGWERAMAKHGWQHQLSIMYKELGNG